MATPNISLRIPAALLALIDARAAAANMSRSEVILDALDAAFSELIPEPAPRLKPAKAKTPKPIAHPAPADRPAAARAALETAEARTGVRARLDTSAVPVLGQGKRPAYQRARDRRPAGK